MLGSSILDIAIGIVFVYLLLSLICTAINEAFASAVQKRSSNLWEGIKNLLNDPEFTGLAQQLYNHGLIDGISEHAAAANKPTRRPSYIPAANFSLAILDILGTRGVVAAAQGTLLVAAEQADDAFETARKAAGADSSDTAMQASLAAARTQRQAAELALTNAAQQAVTARHAAAQAAAADPTNQDLAGSAAKAADAADAAAAAVKMLTSRRAAVDLAADPKNADRMRQASDSLEQALAAARALASKCPDPLGNVQQAVDLLPDGHTKESLHVLMDKTRREVSLLEQHLQTAGRHLQTFQKNIEDWFDDAMARVGGWYKRWTQRVLYVIAAVVVVFADADTIRLTSQLSSDAALRSGLIAAAEAEARNPKPASEVGTSPSSSASGAATGSSAVSAPATPAVGSEADAITIIKSLNDQAAGITLPLGPAAWERDWADWRKVAGFATLGLLLLKLFGLTISVFAVSLGAPFWFDTLSRVVNLRGAGTPPGETKKGASAGTK